ncbi:hypothetical protein F5Y15DRAFT_277925 [Xylariaceae sp. FL0016]|nr:hypothetical protein F5Y15DRAFT_277925 [Xylariaceae sp. FL0016]
MHKKAGENAKGRQSTTQLDQPPRSHNPQHPEELASTEVSQGSGLGAKHPTYALLTDPSSPGHGPIEENFPSPLEALSWAAEQTAINDGLAVVRTPYHASGDLGQQVDDTISQSGGGATTANMSVTELPVEDPNFDPSLDSFTAFLESEPLPSYQFTSWVTAEQPVPYFSPSSPVLSYEANELSSHQDPIQGGEPEDNNSFSRFGSRLPSLQPEERNTEPRDALFSSRRNPEPQRGQAANRGILDLTAQDREDIVSATNEFATLLPFFELPTRLSLVRYIRAYISGFHEHLPFLHIASLSVRTCSIELLLAMAAVGAQYCFESDKGVELFHAARAIATERIRRRDARIALDKESNGMSNCSRSPVSFGSSPSAPSTHSHTVNGPLGLPSGADVPAKNCLPSEDLMQSAQALLILMAMATWAKHKEILREALAIQSILASLVRDDGLRAHGEDTGKMTWETWVRHESVLRTKYVVFCFFNLHSIVYDIPPLILSSELKLRLPCSAAEFKASTLVKWQEAKEVAGEPSHFQDALRSLFSRGGKNGTDWHSSLGNYVLMHAIIQHIFFVRTTARCRFDSTELTTEDIFPLEQALRNWQSGWNRNPESSLDPMDPNGPVAFNSTALLRLAYIRLNLDTGPGRALDTRDPLQIACALRDTPMIKRSPRLARALLHSAHALAIPVKIGIRLVAKTQTFIWSIQHSLCSLECAFLLSKWLEAVSASDPVSDPPISMEEKRILSIVRTMVDETEFSAPTAKSTCLQESAKYLNIGVLRVWATIFRGSQTWAIVDVIGCSLDIYADMLEAALEIT